jgi:hypothetical protein
MQFSMLGAGLYRAGMSDMHLMEAVKLRKVHCALQQLQKDHMAPRVLEPLLHRGHYGDCHCKDDVRHIIKPDHSKEGLLQS